MARTHRAVLVAKVTDTIMGVASTSYSLRRTFRPDGKVRHETLGILSDLPVHVIDLIRRSLQGETFVPAADAFPRTRSLPQGHVEAVLTRIRTLALEDLVASGPARRRDLVIAMSADRLLFPGSQPAHTRHGHDTTSAAELDVADATADQREDAMDRLPARPEAIATKRAQRHRGAGALVLNTMSPPAPTRGRPVHRPASALTAPARPAARSGPPAR